VRPAEPEEESVNGVDMRVAPDNVVNEQ
jgi:hypothetical protein